MTIFYDAYMAHAAVKVLPRKKLFLQKNRIAKKESRSRNSFAAVHYISIIIHIIRIGRAYIYNTYT